MKKRWMKWLLGLMCFALLAALLVFPEPRYAIRGLIRGESFYKWKPSSYWADVLNVPSSPLKDSLRPIMKDLLGFRFDAKQSAIDELFEGDPKALPVLLELLPYEVSEVRHLAAGGIAGIALRTRDSGESVPGLEKAVPAMMECYRNPLPGDVMVSAALGQLGPIAREAVPLIEPGLDDSSQRNRLMTAIAICKIDPQHPRALSMVLSALSDPDPSRRFIVVWNLQAFLKIHGEKGVAILRERHKGAIPVLRGLLPRTPNPKDEQETRLAGFLEEILQQVDGKLPANEAPDNNP